MALRIGFWVYHRANYPTDNRFDLLSGFSTFAFETTPLLPGDIAIASSGQITGTDDSASIATYELTGTDSAENVFSKPLRYEIYFD